MNCNQMIQIVLTQLFYGFNLFQTTLPVNNPNLYSFK